MDWFLQILKFGAGITFQQSHTQSHMWEYSIPQSHTHSNMWEYSIPQSHTHSHMWEYSIPQSHSHTLSHVLVWELELDRFFPSQCMNINEIKITKIYKFISNVSDMELMFIHLSTFFTSTQVFN